MRSPLLAIGLLTVGAAAAHATPINVIGSPGNFPEAFTFQAEPGPSVSATSAGFAGLAAYSSDPSGPYTGTATFGPTSFTAGPLTQDDPVAGSYAFPITSGGSQSFVFSQGALSASIPILWNLLSEIDPAEIVLYGTGTVDTSSCPTGSPFCSDFAPAEMVGVEAYLPIGSGGCPLDQLVEPGGCPTPGLIGYGPETIDVSYFEGSTDSPGAPGSPPLIPNEVPGVPEPNSLVLLLTMLTAVSLWQIRYRQVQG